MSLRLSVATADLNSSLKKAIALAASLEVSGVRLNTRSELNLTDTTASALRQTLLYVKERQMNVAGLLCPTRHSLYDTEFLEQRLDVIRKSMALCRKLETTELVVHCGRIPDPQDSKPETATDANIDEKANPFSFAPSVKNSKPTDAENFERLVEVLNDLTQYGNHIGCVLQLQLASYNKSHIRQLLNRANSGPLKITFDSATAIMSGANAVQTFRDLYGEIGYVRARDAIRDVDGAGTEVAVGDGVVDWVQLFPTLVEAEYRGWVCVERLGGDHRKNDVERGVSFLKTLIPQSSD